LRDLADAPRAPSHDGGAVQNLTWTDHRFAEDPYELFATTGAPVTVDPLLGGINVGAHALVTDLLRGRGFVKHPSNALDGPYTQLLTASSADSMLFMDDPDHSRVRGLVNRAFTRSRVEAMRSSIEEIAASLLDAVGERREFDLVSAFSDPLPVLVIGAMLGVPAADRAQFKRWSDDLVLGFDPFLPTDAAERLLRSSLELREYFSALVEDRRTSPRDDLTSALAHAHDADESLSTDELLSLLSLLLVAGNVTTTDLISNCVLALLQHPEQLALLRADRSRLGNAIEEALRYDSPVLVTDRIPTEDTSVGGCPVSRGQWIWPLLGAANRDPAVHADPDRFDITRERIEHVSFGGGPHYCLGAPLARLEAEIAVGALLDRFAVIELDPALPPRRKTVPGFRGLAELQVRVRS
jgi:hypothetical protein